MRLKHLLLFSLASFLLACSLVGMEGEDPRLRSAHFDRERGAFVNLEPPKESHQFWDYLFKVSHLEKAEWPEEVPVEQVQPGVERTAKGETRVTKIIHSSLLIQIDGVNVLTDPIWSKRTSPVSFAGPKMVRKPAIAFDDLPPIDLVLISHDHYDHLDLPTLRRLEEKHSPRFLVGLGVAELLREEGMSRVSELDWWQEEAHLGLKLAFVPTQHFSSRYPWGRMGTLWGGFVIKGSQKIYFGGDTGFGPHFTLTRERYGAFDLAILPIGAYEPSWFMAYYHMNPKEALQAHRILGAKRSIGIHHGSVQLTLEGIDQPLADLREAREELGLARREFAHLDFGEEMLLEGAGLLARNP